MGPVMNKNLSNLMPTFSTAGIWVPNGVSDPITHNQVAIANAFYSPIDLSNGRTGLVLDGWSYSGFGTTQTFYPVNAAILEQDDTGALSIATGKYLTDPTTDGAGSVNVADFNGDGWADIFLAAHNESPFVAKASTVYLSNAGGTFDKVTLSDRVEAHDARVGYVNGIPTVFAASFDGDPNPYYQYSGGQFTVTPTPNSDTVNKTIQGNRFPVASIDTIAVANVYQDSAPEVVVGDLANGPGYPFVAGKPFSIAVYRLTDYTTDTSNGAPLAVLTPYFTNKPEYAGVSSYLGPGQSHTHRVWTDDFNHDGRTDILAGVSLWPAALSKLQMFQNTSVGNTVSFADKTDYLGSGYSTATQEVDYSMQIVDIDGSGINSYLLAGSLSPGRNAEQNNYILLNDGTGMLHVYMHDEFQVVGDQVNAYVAKTTGVTYGFQPRFIEYLTPDKTINLVAEVPIYANTAKGFVLQHDFVNVPLQLNPAVDYTGSIYITDRNGSSLIRTWAGNDTIGSANASVSATRIDGGLGTDTATYSGKQSDYVIAQVGQTTLSIRGSGINDTLSNVERLKFSDKLVAVDIEGAAGQAYRLYQAAFHRPPDKEGVSYWTNQLDHGDSLKSVAENFIISNEFKATFGDPAALSNSKFLDVLYTNILGRPPEASGKAFWQGQLDQGLSRATVLALFSESPENVKIVGSAIQNGITLDPHYLT